MNNLAVCVGCIVSSAVLYHRSFTNWALQYHLWHVVLYDAMLLLSP